MKKQSSIITETNLLRQRAEALLKKRKLKDDQDFSEAEMRKIFHELQVHQIELEMQNEELLLAKKHVEEAANEKFAKLYNLSPSGYFTLSREGIITEMNKSAAKILENDSEILLNTPFDSYLSNHTKENFHQFIDKLIHSNANQTCDVVIQENLSPKYINLTGIFNPSEQNFLITTFDNTNCKHAEVALAEKDEFLQTIYDHSGISTYVVTVLEFGEYKYEHVNKTYEACFGLRRDEIMGKMPNELAYFYGLETTKYIYSIFNLCTSTKKMQESEYEAIWVNGKKDWWLSRISPLIDNQGKVYKLIGTTIKITDRKQTEIILKESEQKFKDFVNHSPDIIYKYSSVRGSLFWSESVKNILGYSPEEIQENPFLWSNSVHPDFKALVQKAIEDEDKAENYSIEYRIRSKSGKWVWLHNNFRHKTKIGNETIIEGYARDITAKKEAEIALIKSEEKYRLLFENMNSGFQLNEIIVDADNNPKDFRILDGNKLMKAYTDFSIDEVRGKTVKQIFPTIPIDLIKKYGNVAITGKAFKTQHFVERLNKYFNVNVYSPQKGQFAIIFEDITERKQIERALQQSEAHLQLLIKGTQDYYFRLKILADGSPIMEYVSDNYYATTGKQLSDIQTLESWNDILYHEDLEMVHNNLFSIIKTGKSAHFECRSMVNKEMRYIEINSFPTIDESNGKVKYILGSVKDITLRKKAEEALSESNKKFMTLANLLPAYIAYVNADTLEYEFVNKTYESVLGIPLHNIKGHLVKEILGEANFQLVKQYIEKVRAGKSVSFETDFKIATGKRWINSNYVPDFDENGKVKSVVVLTYDITERKLAEEALVKNEIILNISQQLSKTGGWEYDLEAQTMFWTDETYRIHDCDLELMPKGSRELIELGAQCYEHFDRMVVMSAFNRCVSEGEPYDLEFPFTTFKGRRIWIKTTAKAMKNSSGKITKVVGNIMDITERKKSRLIIQAQNQELIKLNADKDRFLTILAHDLKNPFNSLMGLSELLSKNMRKYDMANTENLINIIHRTAKRTYHLLEDLLLWATSQSGKLPFNPQKVSMASICDGIMQDLQLQADNKTISLDNLVPLESMVFADIDMLKTVLRNLVSNAIKFTNKGGKIAIYAKRKENYWVTTVIDDGIGMSNEVLGKLLDISKTYTTKGTEEESGTGLGLLLCKEFIEKQGGKIWIDSEVGKGSEFKFLLPVGDE